MFITRLIKAPQSLYRLFRNRHDFKSCGPHSYVIKPLRILGGNNIVIGDRVSIHNKTWLQAVPLTGKQCSLIIKDGTTIGDFNHIVATENIEIQENVLTANFVYISDNAHNYEDVNVPVKLQSIKQLKRVVIGEGCWIGEHVSVIGASVGKQSVIGANSVVTHDIPDYCVAVGAPAYIIKRYNFETGSWEKTDKYGKFIQ